MEKTALQENRMITDERINEYKSILICDEKSEHTIEKYLRDIKKLQNFLSERELTKELLIEYKAYLKGCGKYITTSVNSFLSAANCFCSSLTWHELHINTIRIQQQIFKTDDKELTDIEFRKLVDKAHELGKERLALIMQTLAGTGIRISELSFVTAESLVKEAIEVDNKGKVRSVMFPKELVKILKKYAMEQGITSGSIFITKKGKPVDRSNIWRDMRKLCDKAGVARDKVFPHNLRHLFARTFYSIKKDIALLADVLGHSNLSTTRIYIRTTGKEHQEQLDDMYASLVGIGERCNC